MGKNKKATKSKKGAVPENTQPNTNKYPVAQRYIDPKDLVMPPKYLFEERIKLVLAIILFILFLLFFGGIAWFFLSKMDASFVDSSGSSSAVKFILGFIF